MGFQVQGIEELPPPDPLPAAVATDSAHLIETFGEHIIKCLYSKVSNVVLRRLIVFLPLWLCCFSLGNYEKLP